MAKNKYAARFAEVYSQNTPGTTKILVDLVTGVNYFFHAEGNAGGMTPLLKPDGTPVVTPPEMLFPQ